MSYLLLDNARPVEWRLMPPDSLEGWIEVMDDDPRIAQIRAVGTSEWGAFRMGLLNDETPVGQSFQEAIAVFFSANLVKVNTLMSEANKDAPYVPYLVDTWNFLVEASGYVPGEGVVDGWNDLAVLCKVPLRWLPDANLTNSTE